MRIVCGTDFSSHAAEAADVAADLASRFGTGVQLVHGLDSGVLSLLDQNRRDYLLGRLRKRLSSEVERLRATGAEVEAHLADGSLPRVLAEFADRQDAALIAVSFSGVPYPARWSSGSIAERTAQKASVPTLAIRDAAPLRAWVKGNKALNIFVCYDFSATSDAALRFVGALKRLGCCRVTVVYLSWPPHETWRLGLSNQTSLAENAPEVQKLLEADLRERCGSALGESGVSFRVIGSWGEIGPQLVELAKAEEADLIVVGTNQRSGLDRFWLGSVSREVLHRAPTNVVCVPAAIRPCGTDTAIPRFTRVLVSTDMSPWGNKAIPYACEAARRGGELLLVHVIPPSGISERDFSQKSSRATALKQSLLGRLHALIPNWTQDKGVRTRVEIVEHQHAAVGVCQAAERFRAELICMASQGRTALKKKLLGSVTEAVMRRSKRPVLVIRE